MKESKKGILSSFIKYLKSLIQNVKGDFKPLIRKEPAQRFHSHVEDQKELKRKQTRST
jgi:hypothetical protein